MCNTSAEFLNMINNATSIASSELYPSINGSAELFEQNRQSVEIAVRYFNLYFTGIAHGLVAIVGVASNVINMAVFARIELKDTMAVGLFSLSLADFFVTIQQTLISSTVVADIVYPENAIDFFLLKYYIFSISRFMTYLISCWITVLVSAERALCVMLPFQIKQLLSRTRCVGVVVMIYMSSIALHLPVFLGMRLGWVELNLRDNASLKIERNAGNNVFLNTKLNIADNTSFNTAFLDMSPHSDSPANSTSVLTEPPEPTEYVFTIIFSEGNREREAVVDILGSVGLQTLAQVIVLVCAVCLATALHASSHVRRKPTGAAFVKGTLNKSLSNKQDGLLSSREKVLVRTAMGVAVIFTVCSLPRSVVVIVWYAFPEFKMDPVNWFIILVLWEAGNFCTTLSCSVNFLVYVVLNSKYWSCVKYMFKTC